MTSHHKSNSRELKLNVGSLLKRSVGTTKVVSFDAQNVTTDDVELGYLYGDLELTRTAQGVLLQGSLEAETFGECVRCLAPAAVRLTLELSEHFIYPPSSAADGEYSVSDGGTIDLAPILREDAILAIPMHVVCQPDCRGLCSQCGQNLNETECECDHSSIDPRLATLKTLLEE